MSSATTLLVTAWGLGPAACAAAALDSGQLGADDTVLVLADPAEGAEALAPLSTLPAAEPIRRRFQRTVDLGSVLSWVHPAGWRPRGADLAVHEAALRREWGLAGALTVASASDDPNPVLWHVFAAATLVEFAADARAPRLRDTGLPGPVRHRVTGRVTADPTAVLREAAAAGGAPGPARPGQVLLLPATGRPTTDDDGGWDWVGEVARAGWTEIVWVAPRTGLRVPPAALRERATGQGILVSTVPTTGDSAVDTAGWSGPVVRHGQNAPLAAVL